MMSTNQQAFSPSTSRYGTVSFQDNTAIGNFDHLKHLAKPDTKFVGLYKNRCTSKHSIDNKASSGNIFFLIEQLEFYRRFFRSTRS